MSFGSPRSTLVAIFALAFVNCGVAAAQGPGEAYPATAEVSDQKAGSVLLYPYYTSTSGSNTERTRVNISQTADTATRVGMFFIRSNGSVAARNFCLAPKQTFSFLVSEFDPDNSGYILLVSVDANGCPVAANTLIGDASVKRASGHSASLTAYAYAALFTGTLSGCGPTSTTANVNLDGVAYNRSPRTVAIDKVRSRADGNDTLLILNRVGGSLATGFIGGIGDVSGTLFDESGAAHSFAFNAGEAQLVRSISRTFPVTAPSFETVVPAGTVGWMKMAGDADIGLLGAVVNYNPNANAQASAFNGGHGLRALTVTPAGSFVIPVTPPDC